jgi:hypothetical protein
MVNFMRCAPKNRGVGGTPTLIEEPGAVASRICQKARGDARASGERAPIENPETSLESIRQFQRTTAIRPAMKCGAASLQRLGDPATAQRDLELQDRKNDRERPIAFP